MRQLRHHIQNGWKFEEGLLTKGGVKKRPTAVMPVMHPFEQGYSPRVHAFALRLGAEFIESGVWAGKYRHHAGIMDHMGRFVADDRCPECGSGPHGELRFRVMVKPHPNPWAQPWEQAYTFCRRCCSLEEIAALRGR